MDTKNNIRLRGTEVSRLEGFSDAVFAFALTLLVVSLEVPKTFAELVHTMQGFFAFAICFAMIVYIWHIHYTFFRHYGLQDPYTILLNSILMFVVLFYVYPLKFVFTNVMNNFIGVDREVQMPIGSTQPVFNQGETSTVMIIYGLGYIAVFAVFILLHLHAYNKREELALSNLEIFDTKVRILDFSLFISVGLISIGMVLIGGERLAPLSGFSYFLIGIGMSIHRTISGRRRNKLEKAS